MINAVTSSNAASSTTAAARQQAEETAARRAGAESSPATAAIAAPVAVSRDESAVVTLSPQAQSQQAQAQAAVRTVDTAAPTKPDWSFSPPDGNKDGRVTYFEQQFYDIRNFPDSLQQVLDLNKDVVAADQQKAQEQQSQQATRTVSAANADLKAYEDVANAGRRSP